MEGFKKVFDGIAAKAEANAQQRVREGFSESLRDDGLLHCDVCGDPTETVIHVFGKDRKVRIICSCTQAEKDLQNKIQEARELKLKIARARAVAFSDTKMLTWTFENADNGQPKAMQAARAFSKHYEDFRAAGKGLLLFGDVGTGKTFTAACIANEIINKGHSVLMTSFGRILRGVQDRYDGRGEYLAYINSFDLLIIDDLDAERSTEFSSEIIYSVIDARYRSKRPLIVTTNLTWDELADTADRAKKRIYSRLIEICYPVKFEGEDRRKAAAASSFDEFNKILHGSDGE